MRVVTKSCLVVVIALAILLSVSLVGTWLGFRFLGDDETQAVYHAKIELFARHGPEIIEATPFLLERSTQVIRVETDKNGAVATMSVLITEEGGTHQYSLELNEGRYLVTDLSTGRQTDRPSIPPVDPSGLVQPPTVEERLRALEGAGLKHVGDTLWRDQTIAIYEASGPFVGQATKPTPDQLILPVVYDLSPVAQRVGLYLDLETGIAVKTYRYAVDADGNETLIQSLHVHYVEKED